nr:hypothetical protein [Tanacetum cinerariifolium]
GGWGRGVKENHTGLGNDTSMNVGNDAVNYTVNAKSYVVDESVAKNSGSNNVNTPTVNLEKPLELDMGAHINDTANVEAYGFFLEKWVAYLVVTNYVITTWSKYGLVKSMLNLSNSLFFFQFSSKDGLDAMLLQKEDVGTVHVWVEFYGVPMTAFSEDGLRIIATKLDTSLMLDSYTSDMCMQSWGRSNYARAMIDLQADEELKNTIVVAMPKVTVEGFNLCTICVEYV